MIYSMEELLPIVQGLVEKYTNKDSTSVTYEKAQQLMRAVIYCMNEIGIYEKDNGKETYELLNQNSKISAQEAYQLGYKLCLDKFSKANELYVEIMNDFKSYRNQAYHDTIVDGIPAFFKYYEPRFDPQNHILTLDYPVLADLYGIYGIDAIYRYLLSISMEQMFLSAFPEESVNKVLISYHNAYEDLFINICSIVLRKLLVNLMVGKSNLVEALVSEDYLYIKKSIQGFERSEIESKMETLLMTIVKNGYNNHQDLFQYLKKDISDFVSELINAIKYDNLTNLIK